jgi:hypothetical protein
MAAAGLCWIRRSNSDSLYINGPEMWILFYISMSSLSAVSVSKNPCLYNHLPPSFLLALVLGQRASADGWGMQQHVVCYMGLPAQPITKFPSVRIVFTTVYRKRFSFLSFFRLASPPFSPFSHSQHATILICTTGQFFFDFSLPSRIFLDYYWLCRRAERVLYVEYLSENVLGELDRAAAGRGRRSPCWLLTRCLDIFFAGRT